MANSMDLGLAGADGKTPNHKRKLSLTNYAQMGETDKKLKTENTNAVVLCPLKNDTLMMLAANEWDENLFYAFMCLLRHQLHEHLKQNAPNTFKRAELMAWTESLVEGLEITRPLTQQQATQIWHCMDVWMKAHKKKPTAPDYKPWDKHSLSFIICSWVLCHGLEQKELGVFMDFLDGIVRMGSQQLCFQAAVLIAACAEDGILACITQEGMQTYRMFTLDTISILLTPSRPFRRKLIDSSACCLGWNISGDGEDEKLAAQSMATRDPILRGKEITLTLLQLPPYPAGPVVRIVCAYANAQFWEPAIAKE